MGVKYALKISLRDSYDQMMKTNLSKKSTFFPLNLTVCISLPLSGVCVHTHMHVCACVPAWHMCTDSLGGQMRALNPLVLKLLVVMNHLMWVLGIKLGSSERSTYTQPLSHLSSPCSDSR